MSRRLAPWAILALGFAAFVLTRRFHPIQGLGNPDIGGILYSADTINHGLLPYRDTFDAKQPGSFFLVAAVLRISRSIDALQLAFAAWLLAGAPAIWVAARSLYRDVEAPHLAPAIGTALYLLLAGTFDLNYAAWMMTPYAWSFALLCRGLSTSSLASHAGAAVFAVCSYLVKAQAVVVVPLFILMWLWGRRRGLPGATWRAWPAWLVGTALALAPLVALYATKGATAELWRGLVPLGDAAAYGDKRVDLAAELAALWKVPRQQIRAFFVPLTLGVAAFAGWLLARRRREDRDLPSFFPALLFYVSSVVGCAIGGRRFFVHYLPQCLPAMALLGAHPAALRWLFAAKASLGPRTVRIAARLHAALVAGLLLFSIGRIFFGMHALVDNKGSSNVERAGQYVKDHSRPDETLLVWGWSGWGTYFYSDRRSPSPIFKVLGQVTEYNDNTAFSKGTSIHFKPGPMADRLLADLKAAPPAFIIRASPFFPGTTGDPLDESPELKTMLSRQYKVAASFGHLTVYERRRRK